MGRRQRVREIEKDAEQRSETRGMEKERMEGDEESMYEEGLEEAETEDRGGERGRTRRESRAVKCKQEKEKTST